MKKVCTPTNVASILSKIKFWSSKWLYFLTGTKPENFTPDVADGEDDPNDGAVYLSTCQPKKRKANEDQDI